MADSQMQAPKNQDALLPPMHGPGPGSMPMPGFNPPGGPGIPGGPPFLPLPQHLLPGNHASPPGMGPGGPRPGMPFMPPGLPPPGLGMPDFPRPPLLRGLPPPRPMPGGQQPFPLPPLPPPGQAVWFEHKMPNGKAYFSNAVTRETQWVRPKDALVHPGPPAPVPPGSSGGETAAAATTTTGASSSSSSTTPSTAPPPSSSPSSASGSGGGGGGGGPAGQSMVPARVWAEHRREDGRVYYYNKITMQSVWSKPPDVDLVLPMPLSLAGSQPDQKESGGSGTSAGEAAKQGDQATGEGDRDSQKNSSPDVEGQQKDGEKEEQTKMEESADVVVSEVPTPEQPSSTRQSEANQEPPAELAKKKEQQQHHHPPEEEEGTKPIATQPVSGTAWSIVWTNDERYFFFNATTRDSVWTVPEDIQHLAVLKVLLAAPPGRKRPEVPSFDVGTPEAKKLKPEGMLGGELDGPPDPAPMEVGGQPDDPKYGVLNQRRASMSTEERIVEFKEMLLERAVSAFSTWDKELPKFCFDERYRLLNAKERKSAFDEFVRDRAEDERREKKQKLKQIKDNFKAMLEEAKLTPKSTFGEISGKFSRDERFKAVERVKEREAMIMEFITNLKKTKKDAEKAAINKDERIKDDFFGLLASDGSLTSSSSWKHVKSRFRGDPAYSAVERSSHREQLFHQYQESLDRERIERERIQHSLREREKEVQMSRSKQEKEWDKEREGLRRSEALGLFRAMLADLVRRTDLSWHDARKTLKKDSRWDGLGAMESEERETIFRQHVKELLEKKRTAFRKLLSETAQITLTLSWRKAKKLIKNDLRYEKFGSSDKDREDEYDEYLTERMTAAKREFRQLLKEVRTITYRSKKLIRESKKHLDDIVEVLKNDRRFLVLDCVEEEREEIMTDYIDDLHDRGPPPPPTATARSERPKRP